MRKSVHTSLHVSRVLTLRAEQPRTLFPWSSDGLCYGPDDQSSRPGMDLCDPWWSLHSRDPVSLHRGRSRAQVAGEPPTQTSTGSFAIACILHNDLRDRQLRPFLRLCSMYSTSLYDISTSWKEV